MNMKYYLIYKNDEFIGYADDKEILKTFLSVRKNKYTIRKIKSKELPEKIRLSMQFENKALAYYQGYNLTNELPIFIYEFSKFDSLIREELITILAVVDTVRRNIDYLRTKKCDDLKLILDNISQTYGEFIVGIEHEPIYDEVFNVLEFFKLAYKRELIH